MSLQLRIVSHSEVGLVRKNNQDSGYASPQLLVVADGMGGAAAGDLASAIAIDTIRRIDRPVSSPAGSADRSGAEAAGEGSGEETVVATGGTDPLQELAAAIRQANDRIADFITADYALEGMGTTVTGAVFDGTQLGLAHIGDSRAYLLRDGRLERLTHDHSWVQSLIDDGKISEAEAAVHPHRSLLLKVLNGQPANDPDLTVVRLQAGDRVLFCSDGICGLVDDPEIRDALRTGDPGAALRELVELALAEGGIDNITAIVADVVDGTGSVGTAVLGAAAERDLPDLPTSATGLSGLAAEDDDDDEEPPSDADTAVRETEDEARYNPRPPHRRRLRRSLVSVLVVLLIAAAGLGAGYAWTRSQYYVGAAGEQVAIFQGLPDGLPGISLSQVYEVQPLAVSALPPYYQAQVTEGIEVSSLEAARQTVAELTETAERCAAVPTPKPRPSASTKPSGTATTTARPSPSRSKATTSATQKPTPTTTSATPTPTPTVSRAPEC